MQNCEFVANGNNPYSFPPSYGKMILCLSGCRSIFEDLELVDSIHCRIENIEASRWTDSVAASLFTLRLVCEKVTLSECVHQKPEQIEITYSHSHLVWHK